MVGWLENANFKHVDLMMYNHFIDVFIGVYLKTKN